MDICIDLPIKKFGSRSLRSMSDAKIIDWRFLARSGFSFRQVLLEIKMKKLILRKLVGGFVPFII